MENKARAIMYMALSGLAFAFMGATVKLAGDIPVFEKVFFRNFVSLFVALYMIKKSGVNLFGEKKNQKVLLMRSLCGFMGVVTYFYSINRMFLADSTMLNKLSPFFVTIFAFVFLKEKLSKIQVPVLVVAFLGAVLIIKPEFSFRILPALSALLSAVFAGAAYTFVRYLKGREEPATIVFYFSFVSVVGTLPFLIGDFKLPDLEQLACLLGTGLFAAIGQFMITMAYKNAPASEVSIYNYLSIIFSSMVGFAVWREVPDSMSILGGALIVSVAVFSYLYNKREEKIMIKNKI